jgi:glycosyltransferase involved in cell wall biosynthesis
MAGLSAVAEGATTDRRRIAIFMSTSGHSGVDRAMKNLIPALAGRGYAVDLIKVRRHGPDIEPVPDGVRIIDSGAGTTYLALPALVRYLRRERPAVLLSDKDRVNRTALLARWLAGARSTRVVLSSGTTISIDLRHRGFFERRLQRHSMGQWYRIADVVIVPGKGVADDMAAYTGLPREHIVVVPNPLVPPALLHGVPPAPEHPWFAAGEPPVILGVGELGARKDFAMLLRAFARLRAQRPCRLMVLGKGRERDRLLALADELGIRADFELPGYVEGPFAYMAHAAAFALCSRWEGLPSVPVEALAVGTPVVATATPGSVEILEDGKVGPLVPIGDDAAMAEALAQLLDAPRDRELLRRSAMPYEFEAATSAYLRVFRLPERAAP